MNETDKIVDINSYEKQENYEETDEQIIECVVSIFIWAVIAIFQILGIFVSKLFIILSLILCIAATLISIYSFMLYKNTKK